MVTIGRFLLKASYQDKFAQYYYPLCRTPKWGILLIEDVASFMTAINGNISKVQCFTCKFLLSCPGSFYGRCHLYRLFPAQFGRHHKIKFCAAPGEQFATGRQGHEFSFSSVDAHLFDSIHVYSRSVLP